MNVKTFPIQGPILIELKTFADARGFFTERYRKDLFTQPQFLAAGLGELVQENFSRSAPGVLRGLHYQWDKPQGKLVTCMSGAIYDVAVDIRKNSPTFGQHIGVEIDGDHPAWFWIPAGFAHGFCVLSSKPADVMYKVDNYYNSKGEYGIRWNDPALKIDWPESHPILSPKDEVLPGLNDYSQDPKF